ncbi:MAG: ribonuclease R [Tissierellia bacterium]|nr:ribonuclease R [Tissierellia bacterium]
MTLKEKLLKYIQSPEYKGQTKEELAAAFNIDISDYRMFFKSLIDMEKNGTIYLSKKGKYLLVKNEDNALVGKIIGNAGGFAFFESSDENQADVFIPPNKVKGALHGDTVLIKITKQAADGMRSEGEVVRILNESEVEVVGTLVKAGKYYFVEPNNSKFSQDIFIHSDKLKGAKNEDKVVAKIVKRSVKDKNPEGIIVEVLGNKNDEGIEITSIARQFGLPYIFPKKVIAEAKSLPDEVSELDLNGRTDMTDLFTVTIDGASAKDFDDAISIKKENGNYKLFVHIADVANYVRPNSELDREAYNRGNSVYMLDRVIPMLPEELSNELCSLKPGVVRLSHTVEMSIDNNGKVLDYQFYKSYIKSDHRLIYDDVSDFLEDDLDIFKDEKLKSDLQLMKQLYSILKEKRDRKGAIEFNLPEPEITMGDKGEIVDICKRVRRISDKIIEEFMIVTNETVAAHFGYMDYPFIFRIHEEPSRERIKSFEMLMSNLGYRFKGKEIHSKDFQELLEEVKGKNEESLISSLLLRSLRKAVYSREPDIHFGLSSNFYTHFTAPIRRYSDLFIHRIFKKAVENNLDMNYNLKHLEKLDDIAEHVSDTERKAEEAEREVEAMLKMKYMKKYIGKKFNGIISSLTSFGVFVELENTVEGLVHFRDMNDDYYYFDDEKYVIIGEKTNRRIKLGDSVKIKVKGVNESRNEINFEIVRW